MDNPDIDHLWKTVDRFDGYINSTNVKAAFLIAFNSALFVGVVFRWKDLMDAAQSAHLLSLVMGVALSALGVSSLASTWLTFRVVTPYLESAKRPGEYHSVLFFTHVAEHREAQDYVAQVRAMTLDSRGEDLAKQAHALANALEKKFGLLKAAIAWVVCGTLPALAILGLAIFVAHFV